MKGTLSLIVLLWGMMHALTSGAQGWQWGKGTTGGDTDGWPVATDKFGNVFCAALRSGNGLAVFDNHTVPFSGGSSDFQSIVAKYDANGNFLWARGNDYGNARLINIATDPDGNVYMLCSFDSGEVKIGSTKVVTHQKYIYQYLLTKIDPFGNVLWTIADGNTQSNYQILGNITQWQAMGAITTDNSGNVYVTVNFNVANTTVGAFTINNTDPSGRTDDILVAKYDPGGNLVWAKGIGGLGSDDAYAITVVPAGDIYIAGVFNSQVLTLGTTTIACTIGMAGQVAFIARLDGSGNGLWGCSSGGAGNEYASGLASDNVGNVYLTGGFKDNSISFNGTVINDPYPSMDKSIGAAAYLVKFDPSNNVSWYKTIGAPDSANAFGFSVAVSSCGYVWVNGGVEGQNGRLPVQINAEGNIFNSPPGSYDPVFLTCYTTAGAYVDCQLLESGNDDADYITCDASGNVLFCADYYSPFNINNIPFFNDTSSGHKEHLYIAKYTSVNTNQNKFRHSDTSMCFIPGIQLNAPAGYASYLWSDGKGGNNRVASDTGIIWVRGDDTCGIYIIDTFRFGSYCDCNKYLFVPNSFTPNGDGKNDEFYPRSSNSNIQIKSFRVYNRWGDLVFERQNIAVNDASNAWDGTYQGNLPLPDVYVYMVNAVCDNGTEINKKGSVTVIR